MNRFFSKLVAVLVMASSVVFTSCLSEEKDDGMRQAYSYFTIMGDEIMGFQGYADAGGLVKFENTTTTSKLKGVERAAMLVQYNVNDFKELSDGSFYIANAAIQSAEMIPVDQPMSIEKANEEKVLEPDSCCTILKVNSVWAKKGYLNVEALTYFGLVNGKVVTPKVSFVYDPASISENKLNLKFCFNNNVNNKNNSLATGVTMRSLNLYSLRSLVPGNDSVDVSIVFDGVKNPVTIKMARNDFDKPALYLF